MFQRRSNIRAFFALATALVLIPSISFSRQGFDASQIQQDALGLGFGPHGAPGGVDASGRPVAPQSFAPDAFVPKRIKEFCQLQSVAAAECANLYSQITNINTLSGKDFENALAGFVAKLDAANINRWKNGNTFNRDALMAGLCLKPADGGALPPGSGDAGAAPAGSPSDAKPTVEEPVLVPAPSADGEDEKWHWISPARWRKYLQAKIDEKVKDGIAAVTAIFASDAVSAARRLGPDGKPIQPPAPSRDAVSPVKRPTEGDQQDFDCLPDQTNINPGFNGNNPFDTEDPLDLDRPSGDQQGGDNQSDSPQGGGGGGGEYKKNTKKLEEVKIDQPKNFSPFSPPGPVDEKCMLCAKIEETGRSRTKYDTGATIGLITQGAQDFSDGIQKNMQPIALPPGRGLENRATTRDVLSNTKASSRRSPFMQTMQSTSKK